MISPRRFVPALGHQRLAPLYDPLLRRVMHEDLFKRQLIVGAGLAGMDVLDLGCGTGTLTLAARSAHPEAKIVGLDADSEILARAHAKSARLGLVVPWVVGAAERLPHPEAAFDRVLICLVLHHLSPDVRLRCFREVLRVLRAGGQVHIADFGPPRTFPMRLIAAVLRHLEHTAPLFDGKLPAMLEAEGLVQVCQTGHVNTPLGPIVLLRASKPGHASGPECQCAHHQVRQAGKSGGRPRIG